MILGNLTSKAQQLGPKSPPKGFKRKELVGIPWRVVFELQNQGWYVRQDVIWNKGNPMPESVTDRCTKSHEYIFLLTKRHKYYFHHEAIKEKAKLDSIKRANRNWTGNPKRGMPDCMNPHSFKYYGHGAAELRSKRSVWNINTKPFSGAHFAAFPPELPRQCILAGTRENDLVLDVFNGAGTTGLVSRELNRRYIGIDINKDYLDMTIKRVEPFLNQMSIFDQPN